MDEYVSAKTLDRMVGEIRPDWTLREAVPSSEGTDAVYFVTVETPAGIRECVLKACEFLDPEEFRPEPYLVGAVGRRTSIPVSGVVGAVDDHEDLPAPFFLADFREGEVCENEASDLPIDVLERLAHDAGRHLGELHTLGDFEAFGPVRLARDVDHARGGLQVDGRTLTVGERGADSWRARFEAMADAFLADVDARFADLESDLRTFVTDRLDALDREYPVVLGHDDYRLGNLLVDSETGETRAVLDWGNAHTLEPQYNLVATEQYLSGWASHDAPRRERVRAALHEGYDETNGIDRESDFDRRRDLYLAQTRLWPLVCFSLWYGDDSEEIAEKHRQSVRELVSR